MAGKAPELWDAYSGTIAETQSVERDGRTEVVLDCAPAHSVFVAFRSRRDASRTLNPEPGTRNSTARTLSVTGAWHVTFFDLNRQRNVTAADFDRLASWTESVCTDIRYFSGTATYTKKVACPKAEGRITLDLGEVKNIATVTVNGRTYPTLWKPPFRVDVTDAVKPDAPIDLQIKVTNYWPNRLIGDARHQDDCEWDDGKMSKGYPLVKAYPDWLIEGKRSPTGRHAFSTCRLWKANEPLLESGLIGPVRLIFDSTSSAKVPAR